MLAIFKMSHNKKGFLLGCGVAGAARCEAEQTFFYSVSLKTRKNRHCEPPTWAAWQSRMVKRAWDLSRAWIATPLRGSQ
jgi:hypothetical protein